MNAPLSQADIAQWNHLSDINDVKPLNETDRACLDAVRDVLARFDCLDRFGVNLPAAGFSLYVERLHMAQLEGGR